MTTNVDVMQTDVRPPSFFMQIADTPQIWATHTTGLNTSRKLSDEKKFLHIAIFSDQWWFDNSCWFLI